MQNLNFVRAGSGGSNGGECENAGSGGGAKKIVLVILLALAAQNLFSIGLGFDVGAKLLPTIEKGVKNSANAFGVSGSLLIDFDFLRLGAGASMDINGFAFRSIDFTADIFFIREYIGHGGRILGVVDGFGFPDGEIYFRVGIGGAYDLCLSNSELNSAAVRIPFYLGFLFKESITLYFQLAPAFSFIQMGLAQSRFSIGLIFWINNDYY